jgi:hypothetical protein
MARGERIGVDNATMEADAAMRPIARRDAGESYREISSIPQKRIFFEAL